MRAETVATFAPRFHFAAFPVPVWQALASWQLANKISELHVMLWSFSGGRSICWVRLSTPGLLVRPTLRRAGTLIKTCHS